MRNAFAVLVVAAAIALGACGPASPPSPTAPEAVESAPATTGAKPAAVAPVSGPAIRLSDLPIEARTTYSLIRVGGPFPFVEDGTEFKNREQRLPKKPRAYWREFTVKTPGATDRGARRIVAGGGGEAYWTEDHYATFRRIEE